MSILLAWHGETDWNIANKVQGTTDIPLNENGNPDGNRGYGSVEAEITFLEKWFMQWNCAI